MGKKANLVSVPAPDRHRSLTVRKRNPHYLSGAQIKSLLHSIDNIRGGALIRVDNLVALRVSQAINIRTSGLDFGRGLFRI